MTRQSDWLKVSLAVLATSGVAAAQWSAKFTPDAGLGGNAAARVTAIAAFDDGVAGNAVYAAGGFASANGCPTAGIARWDGSHWSPVAGGVDSLNGTPGQVVALQVFDDGTGPALYAAGRFDSIGGVPAKNIARFDGVRWSALGTGLLGPAQFGGVGYGFSLAVFDDGTGAALYVGGDFETAGGIETPDLARWDGTAWSSVGSGVGTPLSGEVHALEVFDDGAGADLYVGGFFDEASGVPASNVARWDGSGFSSLGLGVSDMLQDFAVLGSTLYAVGDFQFAGGQDVQHVAAWDGSGWSAVGGGLQVSPQSVEAATVFDDGGGAALFVGGRFTMAGGSVPVEGLARWDGSVWTDVGGVSGGGVQALEAIDLGGGAELYVGGDFLGAGAGTAGEVPALRIASFDGADWSALAEPGAELLDGNVKAFAIHDDGGGPALYAGGEFTAAGSAVLNRVARWNGAGWEPLGSGVDGEVRALASFDDGSGSGLELYAGGTFTTVGGLPMSHIAKWNGSTWQPVGTGVDGNVLALLVHDDGSGPALYAGGNFDTAGGGAASNVARWDGTGWSAVGGGTNATVNALAVFDDGGGEVLVAGGNFTAPGSFVAAWDGAAWSPLGTGLNASVLALRAFDPGSGPSLYAGGDFTMAGAVTASKLAHWDGVAWSAGVTSHVLSGPVRALAAADQGQGPELYIGGDFFNNTQPDRIAKVAGGTASELDSGLDHRVYALIAFADGETPWEGLYAGGSFSEHVARWGPACGCDLQSYCTAGTTSSGCQASVSGLGAPALSSPDGFGLTVSDVEGQKQGLIFWGLEPKSTPWGQGSSFLCVGAPTVRTGTQSSRGTPGLCDGALTLDFNAWMAAHPSKAPPAGSQVHVQGWFRDPPAPKGTSLSNGLRFTVLP